MTLPKAEASERLTISAVSARTGVSASTLRFYEDEGMFVDPIERDAAGRRLFGEPEVQWIMMCTRLRSTGMALSEIRRYAGLVRAGAGNEAQRLELLRTHQAQVAADIAARQAVLEVLDWKVGLYEQAMAAGTASTLFTGYDPAGTT